MTTMTAEALHALYAPLWEKIPETRPKHLTLAKDIYEQAHFDLYGNIEDRAVFIEPAEAAALCFRAALTWIVHPGVAVEFRPNNDVAVRSLCEIKGGRIDGTSVVFSAETPDAALVAACLAVKGTT